MDIRPLPRTDLTASALGLGTWQLGADWGEVTEADARAVLEAAVDAGVTFLDTADVYGDGRSEQIIGRFLAEQRAAGRDDLVVATKAGRRAEQVFESYTPANLRAWTERSRSNLGVDRLDLVQLHCPPTDVIEADRTWDALAALVDDGVVGAYGVSVETCDQALAAIARPGCASVQIILNAFRLKPLDAVLPAAREAGVAIIARVPLASGLLSGRYDAETTFAADDHRTYNRDGSAFDVGETFSGVDFATGVAAAQEFSRLVAEHLDGLTPARAALAWVAQQPGVTTVIPGARSVEQARANAAAGEVAPLPQVFLDAVRDLYDERLRAQIHPRW